MAGAEVRNVLAARAASGKASGGAGRAADETAEGGATGSAVVAADQKKAAEAEAAEKAEAAAKGEKEEKEDGEGWTEWVLLEVVGQSFLLHQIRKMVATAVDAARRRPDATPTSDSRRGVPSAAAVAANGGAIAAAAGANGAIAAAATANGAGGGAAGGAAGGTADGGAGAAADGGAGGAADGAAGGAADGAADGGGGAAAAGGASAPTFAGDTTAAAAEVFDAIGAALSLDRVATPMAPALGLYLDSPFFDNYNLNQLQGGVALWLLVVGGCAGW